MFTTDVRWQCDFCGAQYEARGTPSPVVRTPAVLPGHWTIAVSPRSSVDGVTFYLSACDACGASMARKHPDYREVGS